jgi:hypothetical protein
MTKYFSFTDLFNNSEEFQTMSGVSTQVGSSSWCSGRIVASTVTQGQGDLELVDYNKENQTAVWRKADPTKAVYGKHSIDTHAEIRGDGVRHIVR